MHESSHESAELVTEEHITKFDIDTIVDIFLIHTGDLSPYRFPSVIVGISCLVMGAPAAWGAFYGYPYWGAMGVIMAMISFLSDYTFVAAESRAIRRRWFAFDLLAIYIYVVVSVVTVLAHGLLIFTVVVLALLIAGKLVVLEFGARATSSKQWEFRHTIWHVFITTLCMLPHGTVVDEDMQWYQIFNEPIFGTPKDIVVGACFIEAVLQLSLTAVVMCFVIKSSQGAAMHSAATPMGSEIVSKEGCIAGHSLSSDSCVISRIVDKGSVVLV